MDKYKEEKHSCFLEKLGRYSQASIPICPRSPFGSVPRDDSAKSLQVSFRVRSGYNSCSSHQIPFREHVLESVTDMGIQPKYMTGADWCVGRELAGSGLVLTGTGAVSALGWSATQGMGAAQALTTLAVSSVLGVVGRLWGFDRRGQKREVTLAFLPSL
jgi:hypothetical protein